MDIKDIRIRLVDINEQLLKLWDEQRALYPLLRDILEAESDIDKRKEIIDYVFEGKVEEIIEFHFRRLYL